MTPSRWPAVFVVGSVNVDYVARVDALPSPGQTVLATGFREFPGGKGGNQAVAVARLGAPARMIGAVGSDVEGTRAREALSAEGVDTSGLVTVDHPTGRAIVTVDARGENVIAVVSGANGALTSEHIAMALAPELAHGDVVIASLETPGEAVQGAALLARERRALFVLNPSPPTRLEPGLLRLCDLLVPNEHEITSLGHETVESLLASGVGAVITTLGADGADVHTSNAHWRQRTATVDVVDATGAGDAFVAGLAVALLRRLPITTRSAMRVRRELSRPWASVHAPRRCPMTAPAPSQQSWRLRPPSSGMGRRQPFGGGRLGGTLFSSRRRRGGRTWSRWRAPWPVWVRTRP